jgi:hypothetical protein
MTTREAQKTLTIDRSAWFMRYMRWAYDSPVPEGLSFCELFWSLLLSPAVGLLHLLGMGAKAATHGLNVAPRASRLADRLAEKAQTHHRALERAVKWCFGLLALAWVVQAVIAILGEHEWWTLLIPANVFALGWVLWMARNTRLIRVLSTGYHATKTRTCPRVEFTEDGS